MKVKVIGDDYPTSLQKGKVYNVLSVEKGFYRIVDETGEDYLFPPGMFEIER